MKNPLGFLAKQEGPLEVVLFVEVLYLLQAPECVEAVDGTALPR